ncbi:LOW QUALITY PROTEIN: doublesex- and mab-3-related transcription factor C1-like [Trichechus inunguis]
MPYLCLHGIAPTRDVDKLHPLFANQICEETMPPISREFPENSTLKALEASDQALMSAPLEWQRKLEAAEALLTLRNSSRAPSGSISLPQSCGAPAPAENSGLQPPSHSFPRPASSFSLPIGHLGCISFLN